MSAGRKQQQAEDPVEMKFVLLGGPGVGKTSLASRLVYDRFRGTEAPTIGAAFSTKLFRIDAPRQQHGDRKRITLSASATKPMLVKAVLWDTAGQEKYHSLTPMYYRNACCAIICFDITSQDSFGAAQLWADELRLQGPEDVVLCVVGTKADLEAERQIPTSEARAWSSAIGATFAEASALEGGKEISKIFEEGAQRVLRQPKANTRPNRAKIDGRSITEQSKKRWPCFGR